MSADMIKSMTLRWGDYPGLSEWTLNEITSILIRREQRDLAHREKEKVI